MKPNYSPKIDPVVYSELTRGFEPEDWARLALAAGDQAGLSKGEQHTVQCVFDAAEIYPFGEPEREPAEPDYDAPRPLTPCAYVRRNHTKS